jgi:hypothetical protein
MSNGLRTWLQKLSLNQLRRLTSLDDDALRRATQFMTQGIAP